MSKFLVAVCKLVPSRRKQSLEQWLNEDLPDRFTGRIIGIDIQTMLLWGDLVGRLEQEGRPLPMMDSLIASTALQNSLTLVTRNEDDFVGTTVNIFNPWVSAD
ncbi:MAG: type II toxin-antitoxin system VapC family toxin [Cyanothece sp. SIO2G6]|nr:type II toxin-antitoxin system VapC family toxin [Cyanothece sp. SIO2G6]